MFRIVSKQIGFSLIELMVALAIVAILAAVALPAYQGSLQSSRRTDAMRALTQGAALQERAYFSNNRYNANVAILYGVSAAPVLSPDGYYSITVDTSEATCDTLITSTSPTVNTCFVLTATATGAQANDTDCDRFTLNSSGTQSARNSANAINNDCWRN